MPEGCTTIFIGNLAQDVSEEIIRDAFKGCGEIKVGMWYLLIVGILHSRSPFFCPYTISRLCAWRQTGILVNA